MKETEYYIKVHDFLYDDLNLPEVPMRVFAFMFTMAISNVGRSLWGVKFIAARTHLCQRSVKQALKCLINIGLLVKIGAKDDGSFVYAVPIGECESTSQAKMQLVHAAHRCTAFISAYHSPKRCTSCTYGGAYNAPQNKFKEEITAKKKNYGNRENNREPSECFRGSDTL